MSEEKEDYQFLVNMMRFVAAKTAADKGPEGDDIRAMMFHLRAVADQVERGPDLVIATRDARFAARALAGVTAFLQDRILPEALADGNETAIEQIKTASQISLQLSGLILKRLGDEGGKTGPILTLSLLTLGD